MADTNTYISKQKVEKWTTKEKFNALDPRTIETGTEYNLAGPIDETDLGSDLQSKINGKLNAPTAPTAESAVILGTDGTVGTKPLSEIGVGGKLYRHKINVRDNTALPIFMECIFYTTYSRNMTQNDLVSIGSSVCEVRGADGSGAAIASFSIEPDGSFAIHTVGAIYNGNATGHQRTITTEFTDTVTEV